MIHVDIDCDENEYYRQEQTVGKPGDKKSTQHRGAGAHSTVLTPHEATLVDSTGGLQTTTDLAVFVSFTR